MRKTERRYWVNGYQVRGGWHKTLCFSFLSYGILFAWGTFQKRGHFPKQRIKTQIELFKLI